MITTVRALLSIVMLAGFYVLAVAVLVGLGLLSLASFRGGSEGFGGRMAVFAILVAAAIIASLWRVARAKPGAEPGIPLTPEDAPELWATVTELAAAADTRMPDDIRLVPEVNAAVSEDTRWMGLVSGTRRLYLGVPLLLGLDVSQMRSVLAHELGHYSRSHTRLAALTYRGRVAIMTTVNELSGNVVGWLLKLYAYAYLLVSAGVTRRQELEADELSVRIAGRGVAQSALRELPVLDAAWSFYENTYLGPAWEIGLAPTPDGFFSGYSELLTGRADELAEIRAADAPTEKSLWDTHPPIAARVAAMERMADVAVERDDRPAAVLVPGIGAVTARLAHSVVRFGDRSQLSWQELTATAALTAEQRRVDTVYRGVCRLTGAQRASAATLLDLVAAGRGPELVAHLGIEATPSDGTQPGTEGISEPLTEIVLASLQTAAAQSGVATWRHSWTGPAELVLTSGDAAELVEIAALITSGSVAQARARLAELGIDVQSAGQVGERATAHGGELIGGLANIDVNGDQHDVVLLDRGLILIPCPKKKEEGKARLMALVTATPVVELAAQHRFVAFEDVAGATVVKRTPARVEMVLHTGEVLALKESWSGGLLAKDSSVALVQIAEELGAPGTHAP